MKRGSGFFKGYQWSKRSFFDTYLWLCLLFLTIDFVSKWLVFSFVPYRSLVEVIPNFLYITHVYNTGVMFGLGDGMSWSRPLNIAISWIMSFGIFNFWRKGLHKEDHMMNAILMTLEAGAIGNLIDRTFYWGQNGGPYGVVDFVCLYFGGGVNEKYNFANPFASFNIADACITFGIIWYLVYNFVLTSKMTDEEADEYMDENAFWRKKKENKESEISGKDSN